MVTNVGNVGLAIQGIIAEPDEAPMELLGALSGGVSKDEDDVADLAAARESLAEDDIAKLGDSFVSLDNKLQSIVKGSCAA